tara:strand:- start:1559 stop:1753 length:195 start_codon:yes stop_codon:yes gene_type:complete
MKPKSIRREAMISDTTLQSKKMSLETPIGTIESDSGNHYLDIFSITLVIGMLYVGKKLVDKYIK